ncbi:MAG: alpha/beta hydrolase [Tatlockia sp.]|nr:alpha/beta hydrolase [Tatlockia sp.]
MVTTQVICQSEVMIKVDGLEFWSETFGIMENPPIILIMGAGGQGVLWPVEFCEELSRHGYFVIRYDNRDTGLSTSFNFDTHPYTLLDMAHDVVRIMNYYQLQNAHIMGGSMGGNIAMLLGAHFPERVRSLTLMVTTTDMRPALDAFQDITINYKLPAPDPRVLNAVKETVNQMPNTLEEQVQLFIRNAKINSGSIPTDEVLCRELALQVFQRMKNPEGINNHLKATAASYDLYTEALGKITAPTHIIHGAEDPIFPLAHGRAIQEAIVGSTLFVMPGLGHSFANRQFFQPTIMNIITCAKTADNKAKNSS